jgi:hypothetical protein
LLLDALLLLPGHRGISLGDAAPLGLALGIELVPIGRDRGEELFSAGERLSHEGERMPIG